MPSRSPDTLARCVGATTKHATVTRPPRGHPETASLTAPLPHDLALRHPSRLERLPGEYLLDFLRHNESEYLYLVGDIIDGWQLRKGWYWPQAHNDVVQKILRKARKGTQVIYIPGNHDEAARQYCDLAFGDIHVRGEAFHTTLTGKRLWIVHGDLFDGVIQHAKWLAYLGDTLYTLILRAQPLVQPRSAAGSACRTGRSRNT